MASVPNSARVVVIGAGIVGNSLVYHLARLGWRDIVQIDKGPLPNPGGSTGHASNFIFPVDHSREITDLTLDSMRQYKEMGVFTESGGIEVARTEERMQELRRRMSSAKAWGIPAEMRRRPEQVAEKVPFLEPSVIIGGFCTPSVGVVDSLRAGTIMRERALEMDALTVVPNAEVTGMTVEDGRITAVRTDQRRHRDRVRRHRLRRVEPEARAHGRRAHPAHPGRAPDDQRRPGARSWPRSRARSRFPIVRDMDTFCYERQHGSDMEVGSYAHRAILHRARGDPVHRAGQALADRDAVHRRGLRPAAGAGARADAGAARRRGRRDPLRHQRPALADPRRRARSSARRPRSRACGPRPRSGSRRARASAARSPSG